MEKDPNVIELDQAWYRTRFFSGVLALLVPPLGFLLLWTAKSPALSRKILLSVLLGAYAIVHAGLMLAGGIALGWWDLEWRGGNLPALVGQRSRPNPLLLDQDRARQASLPAVRPDPVTQPEPYWTDFRGPKRDGHYAETPILTRWPPLGLRSLWRQPCGGGYASFVVGEGIAFTLEQRRDNEVVAAYHLDSGRELWTYAYPARFEEWQGGDGPRATPTYAHGRVYSLGAQGDLACLGAASGIEMWRRNVLQDADSQNLRYGLAASPLVVGERLIVAAGTASETGTLLAYDALTGDRLWALLPEQQSYASPLWTTLAGQPQVVAVTASRVVGLDPKSREILWDHPWSVRHQNAICLPVPVDGDRLYLGAGYGSGGKLLQIQRHGPELKATTVWEAQSLRTKFNPAVWWEGYLYGLDEGVLTCVDVTTGGAVWRGARYGYGQILLASGHLIVLAADGQLALVRATPEGFHQTDHFRALRGKTWNVPAIAHGRLLVRNTSEMACFRIAPGIP